MDQVQDPTQLRSNNVQKLLACVLATGYAFRHDFITQEPISKLDSNYGTLMCNRFQALNAQNVFNSSIENCQCYLILTGFYSSVSNYDTVHNLVALAHSIAIAQGLNRNKGLYYRMNKTKGNSADAIEMGHRVFWSVVIASSIYPLNLSPPSITSDDYDISLPLRQPSDKCSGFVSNDHDDFEGIRLLNNFLPMYKIISRIIDITSTATRQPLHTAVDEAREELQKWRKTLPLELRIIAPTDMDAIHRQPKFSKFNHAVGYMIEICLHAPYQLHESHRERVHASWNRYCYDAAIGIKNIYNTHSVTRMNAHLNLVFAASAFAYAKTSNIPGTEMAHRYQFETLDTLSNMMEPFDGLLQDVSRRYLGRNGLVKTEPTRSSPLDDISPPQTSISSPTHSTDRTADTDVSDDGASDTEDVAGPTKRIPGQGHMVHTAGHRGFQQNHNDVSRRQSQAQSKPYGRPHPSMQSRAGSSSGSFDGNRQAPDHRQQRQHQRLSQQQPTIDTSTYRNMTESAQNVASPMALSAHVSPTGHPQFGASNVEFSPTGHAHVHHHRMPSNPSLPAYPGDSSRMATDNGFANTHAMSNQDAYVSTRAHSGPRQLPQHPQPFSPVQHMVSDEPSRHQTSVSPTSASGLFNQFHEMDDIQPQGSWREPSSGPQSMMMQDYNPTVGGLTPPTPQEVLALPVHNDARMQVAPRLSQCSLLGPGFGDMMPPMMFSQSDQSSPDSSTSSQQHQASMAASSQAGVGIFSGGVMVNHPSNHDLEQQQQEGPFHDISLDLNFFSDVMFEDTLDQSLDKFSHHTTNNGGNSASNLVPLPSLQPSSPHHHLPHYHHHHQSSQILPHRQHQHQRLSYYPSERVNM